jgi:hypothetical protein
LLVTREKKGPSEEKNEDEYNQTNKKKAKIAKEIKINGKTIAMEPCKY